MQEEVEHRAITLAITASKLTLRVLRDAVRKFLQAQKQRKHNATVTKDVTYHGKQTVKQLVGQGKGVTSIEITDSNIKPFERIARKYGVDFAVKKDASQSPPKYLVFFKAPDNDAMTAAFTEFTKKSVKQQDKPSLMEQIHKFQQRVKAVVPTRAKNKAQEQSR